VAGFNAMAEPRPTYAIPVAGHHAGSGAHPADPDRETQELLERASAVALPSRTVAVIAPESPNDWNTLRTNVIPANFFVNHAHSPLLRAVTECLHVVEGRDPDANAVLIPAITGR
jgi:hypothetical protein